MTKRFKVSLGAASPTFLVDHASKAATRSAASSVAVSFDEVDYLARYPHVEHLIALGEFVNGEDHWVNLGDREALVGSYILLPNADFSIYCSELDSGDPADGWLVIVANFTRSDSVLLRSLLLQSERGFRLLIVTEDDRRAEAVAAANAHGLSDRLVGIASPAALADEVRALAVEGPLDWFVFLDDDVELVPDAVRSVRRMPEDVVEGCVAVYFDEGIVDALGRRLSFRKPVWSPVYFLASAYACGFVLFTGDFLVGSLGELQADAPLPFELMLRTIRDRAVVGHSAQVVSWSGPDRSQPAGAEERDRLRRRVGAMLTELLPGGTQSLVDDQLYLPRLDRDGPIRVSIIIPTADRDIYVGGKRTNLLDQCIETVSAHDRDVTKEFVLVHNEDMSSERQADLRARGCKLVLFDDPEFNFSRKINIGAAAATHDIFLLMNDDVQAVQDWIGESCGYLDLPAVGAVGVRLLFPDGSLQHGGCGIFKGSPLHISYCMPDGGQGSYAGLIGSVREAASVTAACMLTSRSAFEQVGGFDEALPDLYNDADYCLRLREAGCSVLYSGRSSLFHLESVSLDPSRIHGNQQQLFEAKWGKGDELDPFYNPVISRWRPYRWDPPPLTGATDKWAEYGSPVAGQVTS